MNMLDPITLGAVVSILAFISAAVMTITWRMNMEDKGLSMWASAAILGGFGFFVLPLETILGSYSITLNNIASLLSPLLILEGIMRFRRYRFERLRLILYIPIVIYIITIALLNKDTVTLRFLYHDPLASVIFLTAAYILLRKTVGLERKIYGMTAAIFILIGTSFIARWIFAINGAFSDPNLETAFVNYLFFVVIIWIVGWTYGLTLAVNYRNNSRIMKMATHDYLTGLPNRKFLDEYLTRQITDCPQQPLLLFMLDLNGFKQINDMYGHKTGDDVLVKMAESLRDFTWDQHTAVRLGGDEFVVVMKQYVDEDAIAETKTTIRQAVENDKPIENGLICLKTSIGHAAYPADGQTMDELLMKADERMYKEKSHRKLSSKIQLATYQM